jgi:hypothetical protein
MSSRGYRRARELLVSKERAVREQATMCIERIGYVLRDQETAETLLQHARWLARYGDTRDVPFMAARLKSLLGAKRVAGAVGPDPRGRSQRRSESCPVQDSAICSRSRRA